MDSNPSNITYEFRVFVPRSETYAVRLDGLEVTGIYGPLDYQEVRFSSLPFFEYDDGHGPLAWVKAHLCDFILCDTEYDSEVIRI